MALLLGIIFLVGYSMTNDSNLLITSGIFCVAYELKSISFRLKHILIDYKEENKNEKNNN